MYCNIIMNNNIENTFECDICLINSQGNANEHYVIFLQNNNIDEYIRNDDTFIEGDTNAMCLQCMNEYMRDIYNFEYIGTHAEYPKIKFFRIIEH